jgi:redox-sensitive bicupin YhaK (pirin superfamily)
MSTPPPTTPTPPPPTPRGQKLAALDMQEGEANNVRRLVPQRALPAFDPFAQVDEYWMTPPAGFPPHPHQGFEAVVYVLSGRLHHSDTLGNDVVIHAGDVMRFCAGRGLTHSELPVAEGRTHALQLWIALPRADKQCDPDFQHVRAADISALEIDGGTSRLLAGPDAELTPRRNLHLSDLTLDKKHSLTAGVEPGHRGFVYVISGRLDAAGERLEPGEALLFEGVTELPVRAPRAARFVLATAPPIGEPIRQWGHYVS